jgi:nucleoside-diphosphate-sugar epimerase
MKERILITGGAGYVGSVLVPKVIEAGFDVRVLDSMLFGAHGIEHLGNRCEIVKGDIRNESLVKKCLEGTDHVIHLAAIANDPCGNLDPELTNQVNFESTKNLVQAAKEKGVRRFIDASTSSVYGIREEPNVTEDLELRPLTIYSKTKAWAEDVILGAADQNFWPVCIRCATVCGYSPRQRLDVIVNILAARAILKGEITVNGGDQKRPNIHIEDATDLYRDLLSSPPGVISGQIFNFGAENHTVYELAEMVKEVIGPHVEIIKRPKTPDSRSYHISSEKIKQQLGKEPQRTIKDAVVDLRDAFEKGLIPDPESSKYRNIQRTKELIDGGDYQ